MRKINYLIFIFTFTIIACFFVGCSNINFNAVLYDDAESWFQDDFLNDNHTRGAWYDSENDYADDSFPLTRTFIVNSQEQHDEIFKKDLTEFNVNYESEMVIVYTFTTEYHRSNKLKVVELNNDILQISYKMETKSGVGSVSMPYQRYFVIKLDKIEITSVEISEQ